MFKKLLEKIPLFRRQSETDSKSDFKENPESNLEFRWSLYIVKGDRDVHYLMHEDSVFRILGYLVEYFKDGSNPVKPWSLHLNYNKSHTSFELKSTHFTSEANPSTELLSKLKSIDPQFHEVRPAEVDFFMDVKQNKMLQISNFDPNQSALKMLAQAQKNVENKGNSEPDFYSIMRKIFDK